MAKIKVEELVSGQEFKLKGQRKFRVFSKYMELGSGDNIPAQHKGKLLVILSNCRQLILDKETEIEVK